VIDLYKQDRARPNTISVNGRGFAVKTEACHWFAFSEKIKEKDLYCDDFLPWFDTAPPEDMQAGFKALCEFYLNKQPLPNKTGKKSGVLAVDWLIDSEYIYAAFMQCYRIDLIKTDLHWWDFLALFNGLCGTYLNEIMAARTSSDKYMKEAKRAWSLETIIGRMKYEKRKASDDFMEW
jgi:hypothetical protein